MAVDLQGLCEDLLLETEVLEDVLAPLEESAWRTVTPAPGWSVHDQMTHLSYFDEVAIQAALDPASFVKSRADVLVDVDRFTESIARRYQSMAGTDVMSWFGHVRRQLVDVFASLDHRDRLPWYGPDMSVASALTARIMETWAHGQDVVDGLGVKRSPTRGLHQVADLGVRTFANSFRANQRAVPTANVLVELTSPQGDIWLWGDTETENRVNGGALDFCLVVTQRRHLKDTDLHVEGDVAREWMRIAQAFAGPPGLGREPGQFRLQR